MLPGNRFMLFFAIFGVVWSLATADPDPLQNFCVGVNDASATVFVNGKICKNPASVTPEDFLYSGLNIVGNTSTPLGTSFTTVFHNQLPGLNHQGASVVRADYAIKGLTPPHEHPRATELIVVVEGTLYTGFIASNPQNPKEGKLFAKTLNPGDVYVIPRGALHFQYNVGNTTALAFAFFNSQNPGVVTTANFLFGSDPLVMPEILAKAFQLDEQTIKKLQSLQWN